MADDAKKKADKAPVDESPEAAAKKKKKKLLIFAILGALLLIGGGGGAFVFLSKGKKDVKEEEITKENTEKAADTKEKSAEGEEGEEGEGGEQESADAKKEGDAAAGKDGKGESAEGEKKDGEGKDSEKGEAGKDGAKEGKASAEDNGQKVESDIDFGETYKMQTFNLNLGNALENRYIRIEISLEYKGGAEQKKEIEVRLPQLRDAIIGILQRKTREFLLSPDGKESLRKELLIRINRYMTKKIESVYITDLLIE